MIMLETERLLFRRMTLDDVDCLMEIFSDPIAMQYYPSTLSRGLAQKWIEWNIEKYEEHGFGLWICELKSDGGFVGQCGIIPQVVDEIDEREIGYLLARKHWKKGLATEAASAVRDYGFDNLGIHRLIATIYHKNIPSIRVAERLRMKFEKRTFVGTSDDVIYYIDKPTN